MRPPLISVSRARSARNLSASSNLTSCARSIAPGDIGLPSRFILCSCRRLSRARYSRIANFNSREFMRRILDFPFDGRVPLVLHDGDLHAVGILKATSKLGCVANHAEVVHEEEDRAITLRIAPDVRIHLLNSISKSAGVLDQLDFEREALPGEDEVRN